MSMTRALADVGSAAAPASEQVTVASDAKVLPHLAICNGRRPPSPARALALALTPKMCSLRYYASNDSESDSE